MTFRICVNSFGSQQCPLKPGRLPLLQIRKGRLEHCLFLLNVTHHPYDGKDDVKEDSLITKDAEVSDRDMYLYRHQQETGKGFRELQGARLTWTLD